YNGDGDWGDTTQPGDVPMLTGNESQRVIDDFNLSARLTPYKIPASYSETVLPRFAFADARYRATKITYATPNVLTDPYWFKAQLVAGNPVAFGVSLTKDGSTDGGIWKPGQTVYAAHELLMVGYSEI